MSRPVDELLRSFAVSFLPSRFKRDPRWEPYVSDTAHAASGLFQAGLVACIYLAPLVARIRELPPGLSDAAWGRAVYSTIAFYPLPSLLTALFLFDGLFRVLDAGWHREHRGVWVLEIGDWAWRQLHERLSDAQERERARSAPDRLIPPEASGSGMLELLVVLDRGWRADQVVRFRDALYVLAEADAVHEEGVGEVRRYRFKPLAEHALIRTHVVELNDEFGDVPLGAEVALASAPEEERVSARR